MPRQLKQLLIDRVDLVDKGDNPEATIELYKRKEDSPQADAMEELIQKGAIRLTDAMKKLLAQVPDELRNKLAKQMSDEEEAKRKKQEEEEEKKKAEEAAKEEKKKEEEEEEKKKEEEEEEKKKQEGNDDDKFGKGVPADIRKRMEEYEKRATAAEDVAKKLQDDILTKQYVEKAQTFKNLSINAEELGPILKRVSQVATTDYAKLEATLKAADEALASNNLLVTELGKAGKTEMGGNAWQKVEAAAADLQKADPSLNKEVAVAKVLMSNPDLHKQYHDEAEEVQ